MLREPEARDRAAFIITVPKTAWPDLVDAATFASMRASAGRIIGPSQIPKNTALFRRGTSGSGRELLTPDQVAHYYARAAGLAPPDMLTWLHRPR